MELSLTVINSEVRAKIIRVVNRCESQAALNPRQSQEPKRQGQQGQNWLHLRIHQGLHGSRAGQSQQQPAHPDIHGPLARRVETTSNPHYPGLPKVLGNGLYLVLAPGQLLSPHLPEMPQG